MIFHLKLFRNVSTGLTGIPCPCCPPRLALPSSTDNSSATSLTSPTSEGEKSNKDQHRDVLFTASVAELRRKAQEHSAALWQSLQSLGEDSATVAETSAIKNEDN